ncbi:MAG: phosphatidylglycerol lysyltransferase domain-containing protein [Planctomycetaceae bacterium]
MIAERAHTAHLEAATANLPTVFPVDPAADCGAAFVYRHGEQYDSYQASEPKFHQFWSRDRRGVISYAVSGKCIVVRGGLIAPAQFQEELLREFLEFASEKQHSVSFMNMPEHLIPMFRAHGFQISKWGEEPIIDPTTCTFQGKRYEWVRRQTNYCIRNGVVAQEVRPESLAPEEWKILSAELNEVAADSLKCKVQASEFQFFEGEVHTHPLGYRRLFVARNEWGKGRIEGFVVCNPILEGRAWSTEIYRHRRDCVRGTIAFLFQHIIHKLRDEGVSRLLLCLVPGLNCQKHCEGESKLVHFSFRFGRSLLSALFDIDGLHYFKSRFRPHYESRYIFAHPRVSIGSTMAFFCILGIFKIHPYNLIRIMYERLCKWSQRKTMVGIE